MAESCSCACTIAKGSWANQPAWSTATIAPRPTARGSEKPSASVSRKTPMRSTVGRSVVAGTRHRAFSIRSQSMAIPRRSASGSSTRSVIFGGSTRSFNGSSRVRKRPERAENTPWGSPSTNRRTVALPSRKRAKRSCRTALGPVPASGSATLARSRVHRNVTGTRSSLSVNPSR